MLSEISQFELNVFFTLTIVLILCKAALVLFLGFKIYQRKKQTGEFSFGFVFGVFILMICLLVSRIIFTYFDFFLTKFDSTTFYEPQNVIFWKIAMFFILIGYAIFMYIIDRKILDFRFKGLLTYILIGIGAIILFYPILSTTDFQVISTLALGANVIAILIPIIFFYLARQDSPYRLASVTIAIGVILYAIGANLVVESILTFASNAFGENFRIILWFMSLIFKVSGLILFSYGVTQFAVKFSK